VGKNKRMKEARRKKNRTTSLVLDMGYPVDLRFIKEMADGRIVVETKDGPVLPARAWVETTYPREKGDKVTNRIHVKSEALVFGPDLALTQYEWIFAVDTNKPSATEPVTLTAIVQAQVNQCEPNLYRIGIASEKVVEIHNAEHSGERDGWWLVISSIINREDGKKIAILVDAHFSDLPEINRREQPVIGNSYLPAGFDLIYASSDKPNDSIANRLLRRADDNARTIAVVCRNPDFATAPLVASPEYGLRSGMRVWDKRSPVPL
jgi:hypothetical protein